MIVKVDESNIETAARIRFESWTESHRSFCSEEFLAENGMDYQRKYIAEEMSTGTDFYMLVEHEPVGTVSVKENLIENLYILPGEQRKGYGTKLLFFAMEKCKDVPELWILENNSVAYSLYTKHGFVLTGKSNRLSDTISEIEMKLSTEKQD